MKSANHKRFDYNPEQPLLISLSPLEKIEATTEEQNQKIIKLVEELNRTAASFGFKVYGYGNADTYAPLFTS